MKASLSRGPARETVLETERLLLRRFAAGDLETVARWNADSRFMRHLGPPLTRVETAEALARFEQHWVEHGFGLLAVVDRATGALVGRSGIAYHRCWRLDPEVGWAFDPAWWGGGLATEAGAACVRWAEQTLGLERLVSITVDANGASLRVMAKLRFDPRARICDATRRTELVVHARELHLPG